MIAREGWPFILVPVCAGIVILLAGRWVILGVVLIALGCFGLFFFRNPRRVCTAAPEVACSPADGRVLSVGPAPSSLVDQGLPVQVSVFMSVLDVHVNRSILDGTLRDYSYSPGRKLPAFKDKASLDNEQNLSVWEGPFGRFGLKQIAGIIARRIVFDHQPGAEVRRSDRIGLIRYGSRVDIFLPEGTEVLVARGDTVRAGETPLARFQAPVT